MLHYEGANYLLRRMFEGDAAELFQVGVSGIPAMYPGDTPSGEVTKGSPIDYDTNLDIADVVSVGANEGGGWDATFRTYLGYARQAASFVITDLGRSIRIQVSQKQFNNDMQWSPDVGSDNMPAWPGVPDWEVVHGYPYNEPYWRDGKFANPDWDNILAPWTGNSFTLGMMFIGNESKLLFTMRMTDQQIRPGSQVRVQYEGLARARDCTRAWLKSVFDCGLSGAVPPTGWKATLVSNTTLDEDVQYGDLVVVDEVDVTSFTFTTYAVIANFPALTGQGIYICITDGAAVVAYWVIAGGTTARFDWINLR